MKKILAILFLLFLTIGVAHAGPKITKGGGGGGGTGAFSDAGDPVVLNTTTKDVAIGTGQVNTSKFTVDGDADQVQMTIQGEATQTDSIVIIENSAGTEVINLEKDGDIKAQSIQDIDGPGTNFSITTAGIATFAGGVVSGSSANPSVVFKDSDVTDDDDNAKIHANCTDTGSGTEDCDMTFQQQIAGTLTDFLVVDADGDVDFQDRNITTTGAITGNRIVTTTATGRVMTTAEMGNGVVIATAVMDLDLPDLCDSATGAIVTVVARDAEVLSIGLTDTSDSINLNGATLGADDELDSGGTAFESATIVCLEVNEWFVITQQGTWVDGGVPD